MAKDDDAVAVDVTGVTLDAFPVGARYVAVVWRRSTEPLDHDRIFDRVVAVCPNRKYAINHVLNLLSKQLEIAAGSLDDPVPAVSRDAFYVTEVPYIQG